MTAEEMFREYANLKNNTVIPVCYPNGVPLKCSLFLERENLWLKLIETQLKIEQLEV